MALTTTAEIDFKIDAMLCDSVAVEGGKLYLQGGGWNMVNSPTFPVQIPRIGVGAIIHVPYSATNVMHKLLLRLIEDDGDQVPLTADRSELEAQFNVGRPIQLQAGDEQFIPFAVNLDGLSFAKPGTYSFVFSIDNVDRARMTFRLVAPPGVQMS